MMNNFLHLPLQALKTAAREGNIAALDAICAAFEIEAQPRADERNVQEIRPVDAPSQQPLQESQRAVAAVGDKKGRA